MLATIPTLIHQEQRLGHLGWVENRSYLLLLLRPLSSENILSKDKLYAAGTPLRDLRILNTLRPHFPRVVYAPTSMSDHMWRKSAVANWTKVYLAYENVATTTKTDDVSAFQSELEVGPSFHHFYSPFHFDLRHLGGDSDSHVRVAREFSILPEPGITWTGHPPMVLAFVLSPRDPRLLTLRRCLYIHLGTRCKSVARPAQVVHWAHVEITRKYDEWELRHLPKEVQHDCSSDHISSWPDFSRQFGCSIGNANYQITLSFTKFEWDPQRSLVLHLDMKMVDESDNKCDIMHVFPVSNFLCCAKRPSSLLYTSQKESSPRSHSSSRSGDASTEDSDDSGDSSAERCRRRALHSLSGDLPYRIICTGS